MKIRVIDRNCKGALVGDEGDAMCRFVRDAPIRKAKPVNP